VPSLVICMTQWKNVYDLEAEIFTGPATVRNRAGLAKREFECREVQAGFWVRGVVDSYLRSRRWLVVARTRF